MNISDLVSKSDLIIVGDLLAKGPPPPAWSGFFIMSQVVTYRVVEILKGRHRGATVDIFHVVLEGSRTAASRGPGLSTQIFKPGNRLIILAHQVSGPESKSRNHYEDFVDSVWTFSKERVDEIKRLVR